MRRVRHEESLRLERTFQASEQLVDGVSEPLQLVVGTAQLESLVKVRSGDLLCGRGDRAERAQHPAGDEEAERDSDESHDPECDRRVEEQLVEIRTLLLRGDEPQLRANPPNLSGEQERARLLRGSD